MSENLTPAVVIKVVETKPAVVNFNYQEIADHLDSVLAKYKGLVFTESTVADCKKTIAELRKGQKSLDEFRKATKSQLTQSVTAFENQCKTLYGKFDEVIQPLTEQQQTFENDRKEKKRVEIQGIIDGLVLNKNLTAKYASQLVMPVEFLNKDKSIKAIKAELSVLANTLQLKQDKENQDIDLIKTKVNLANAQYQLSLMPDAYLRLLGFRSITEIDLLITLDAQEITNSRAIKAAEVLEAAHTPTKVIHSEPLKTQEVIRSAAPAAVPVTGEMLTAVYEIRGTEEQLSALEAYLDANGLNWVDRPN